ncbi:hypothetical protein QBC37DRAFT_410461 [Rhypophila decipiens]|uniref:Uncharacterized protein n=1 Tax=Rhypophila decipiens TaxID=261697 RepID=A0AAN6YIP9_9PEZI|nr:hypothetical protein QBC37DRAFT_410461 [Rhypophila decipiens]
MFYNNNIALAATGFVALANAHVFMNTPKTFAVPAVHNGPLDPTGADFPCQNRGVEYSTGGVSNVMPLGSRQPLAFTGSAVHGGGSCQISITYDTNPTKNSKWKVIHSIEGGCPVKNTPGNIGDDATMPVPFDFSFPIPDDIPTGNGTLAWTWMNRIGNREFYMNCAPITLTGNGGEKSNFEALPDMFVANIGNDCTTQEKVDYKYPNPGKSVDNFSSFGLVFPQGAGCQKAPGGGGGGGGGSDSGNGGAAPPPPSPPAPSAAPAPAPSVPGGVFITRPTDGVAGQPTSTQAPSSTQVPAPPVAEPPATTSVPSPVVPIPPTTGGGNGNGNDSPAPKVPVAPPATPATPPAPPAPPSPPSNSGPGSGTGGGSDGGSSGSGGAQAAGTACSSEGLWNCVNGSSYQQCASGVWSPVMPLAAGTKCSPGQSTTINIVSASGQRRRGVVFRG